MLRRFPKRNAFISNYIKDQTGWTRTPKQVGSRLQQLRETCTDARGAPSLAVLSLCRNLTHSYPVIRLISSRDFDAPDRVALNAPKAARRIKAPPLSQTPTVASAPSPRVEVGLTPTLSLESLTLVDPYDYPLAAFHDEFSQGSSCRQQVAALVTDNSWPHAYVHLDLISIGDQYAPASQDYSTSFTLDLDESSLTDSPVLTGPDAWKWQRRISVQAALPLCYYVPNVTVSSSILSSDARYKSLFRVQRDHKILFEESTELECVSDGSSRPSLFRTSLIPQSWGSICTKISGKRCRCLILIKHF
jgi:TEA/ATTS domain